MHHKNKKSETDSSPQNLPPPSPELLSVVPRILKENVLRVSVDQRKKMDTLVGTFGLLYATAIKLIVFSVVSALRQKFVEVDRFFHFFPGFPSQWTVFFCWWALLRKRTQLSKCFPSEELVYLIRLPSSPSSLRTSQQETGAFVLQFLQHPFKARYYCTVDTDDRLTDLA